jgi:hypothetical protein
MSRSFTMMLKWVLTTFVCSKRYGMKPPPVARSEVIELAPIEIEAPTPPADITDVVAAAEPIHVRVTFLPQGLTGSTMRARLDGFHQSFQPRRPEHIVLPDMSYLFEGQPVRVLDRRLCERQLHAVMRMISLGHRSATANLIGGFLRQRSKVGFGEFFRFSDFPEFGAATFLEPPPPQTPFLASIMTVVERINSFGTHTCYIEDENAAILVHLRADVLRLLLQLRKIRRNLPALPLAQLREMLLVFDLPLLRSHNLRLDTLEMLLQFDAIRLQLVELSRLLLDNCVLLSVPVRPRRESLIKADHRVRHANLQSHDLHVLGDDFQQTTWLWNAPSSGEPLGCSNLNIPIPIGVESSPSPKAPFTKSNLSSREDRRLEPSALVIGHVDCSFGYQAQ